MERTLQQWKDRLGQITWRWQEVLADARQMERDRNECIRRIKELEAIPNPTQEADK